MADNKSLRARLIGAWELIEFSAHLESDPSNKIYPMGPDAKGIIMYTPDGYMSAQLLTPGQPTFDRLKGSAQDWEQAGRHHVGYTGYFYLDEKGDSQGRPILMHNMRVANLPTLLGDTQRRMVRITEEDDGKYLNLGLEAPSMVQGEMRVTKVRWKRMPDNQATSPPS